MGCNVKSCDDGDECNEDDYRDELGDAVRDSEGTY